MKYLVSLAAALFIFVSCKKEPKKTSKDLNIDYKIELGAVSQSSKFESDTMSIWGGSITKGDDGLYHMFYSRWKKELGWVWETHSEIAHAVADSPFGPFKHKDIALPIRNAKIWDGLVTHNPTVHKFGDKYYLYYMGNTGDGKIYSKPGSIKLNPIHRNNQRIGVAVANSPNGPWKRFNKPLIDVSKDSTAIDALMVSNPSITQRPDGGYLMVYKAVGKKKPGIWGGPVVHCVATSDSPIGPFKKYGKPVFLAEGHDFPAEDPFIWYEAGKYRAILKDMHGAFTDAGQALVLFESIDGFDWKLSKNALVSKLEIKWENGTVQKVAHLERPQVYLENGIPKVLVCASDIKDEKGILHSFNVQIPLKITKEIATKNETQSVFPFKMPSEKPNIEMSAASERMFEYSTPRVQDNELFSQFKYTRLKGFDYNNGDGTISRRDPSRPILVDGTYYIWYTKRHTIVPPIGWNRAKEATDKIPSTDWDLCDIWYATSKDGITWEERGAAVNRPEKPKSGWRSLATPDILVWKGKYYLYYQAFDEPSGLKGDLCPVSVSHADSPNGPWTHGGNQIIPFGKENDWDRNATHDPHPIVYKGKIYIYYKAAYNKWPDNRTNYAVGHGLAIAEDPLGPFEKHPLNPIMQSGHETTYWPFKGGVATLAIKDGNERETIQYSEDGVNFKIASGVSLTPTAAAPFVPDAFTNTSDGRGFTWGLCHFVNAGTPKKGYSIMARFDCDLSLDYHEPLMKKTGVWHSPEVYFQQGMGSIGKNPEGR